jgi:RNA-binding protein with serine-rich domain 1
MNANNTSNIKNIQTDLNPSTILMVSNISRNVTKKHLQEIFSPYGDLKGVYVPRHEETKLQKSYVFLEYGNQDNAEKAMLFFSGGQIDGLVVKVEILNSDNLINNTLNLNSKEQNKVKEENSNKYSVAGNEKEINSYKQYPNFDENENENKRQVRPEALENTNVEMKKITNDSNVGLNKSNTKRNRSRSRSRRRSRSKSNPRYRRDNYKYNNSYNSNYQYGRKRPQDFHDRNKKRYKRRDSRSSGNSSGRVSSRSSRSSS